MRRRVRNRLGDEQLRRRIVRGADGLGTLGWCPACETIVSEGPDACLGYLPGVSWACCGHGGRCPAYVVIGGEPDESCAGRTNYETLRGDAALRYFAGSSFVGAVGRPRRRRSRLNTSRSRWTSTDPARPDQPRKLPVV